MRMKRLSNDDVARILHEMAALYEMGGVQFKPRAYEKAALSVEALDENVREIYAAGGTRALQEIPGVGKGIAEHIEHLLTKGRFTEYERLKKGTPVKIEELTAVEGVGPQTVRTLWKKLRIRNLKELERAARAGKIRTLPGFGKKTEEKILNGIAFLKSGAGRKILGFALPDIRNIEQRIRDFPEVEDVMVAGSVRRFKETIGDIDILATSKDPERVMDRFVNLPFVAHVYDKGPTKTNVRLKNGLDADLRVVPKKSWGAALNYFTGSKAHNIELRRIALARGWKLSEYGLFASRGKTGRKETFIAGKTEEELYKKLGFRYIEPELREMTGEIAAARENRLPKLVEYRDLRGDLQIQTTWTDGENTVEEYAEEAQKLGLEYIAITDHTKTLAMTGGSDEAKLKRQIKEIDKINSTLKLQSSNFRVLKGAEVNILKDGTLDIDDETLALLDVVGAAVHSHFNLPRDEQTKRVIRAMENPNVDIIFHLTTRILNRRKGIDLDTDEVIKAAQRTKTVIEIDAYPDRSDIDDALIKKCVEAGVKMSVDTDAHSVGHLRFLEYGAHLARRGWAKKEDIVNTLPVSELLGALKR